MLKTEVDILVKADHPNVVKLYKVHETDTVLYLVLEVRGARTPSARMHHARPPAVCAHLRRARASPADSGWR